MKLYSLIALLFLVNIAEAQFWRDSATFVVPSPSGKKVRFTAVSIGDTNTSKVSGTLAYTGSGFYIANGSYFDLLGSTVSTDTATFVTKATPQVISARKYFTQLLSADTMATGHIDPRSSSGGVSIHNANHVDVATFGVGSASSTNSAMLGNLAITGYTTGSARATFPSLETDTIQSKTPSGNVVVNDTLYASALGVDTTVGTGTLGQRVAIKGSTGNFMTLYRLSGGGDYLRLHNTNVAPMTGVFMTWGFGSGTSNWARIGAFPGSTNNTVRTSGFRILTTRSGTEANALLIDTLRRFNINASGSVGLYEATTTGQFAIYNNSMQENIFELYNSRGTLVSKTDSTGRVTTPYLFADSIQSPAGSIVMDDAVKMTGTLDVNTITQTATNQLDVNPFQVLRFGRSTNYSSFRASFYKGDNSTTEVVRVTGATGDINALGWMRIGSASTTPVYPLDVFTNGASLNVGGNANYRGLGAFRGASGDGIVFVTDSVAGGASGFGTARNNWDMMWFTRASSVNTERMRLTNAGNLAIGDTVSTTSRLKVKNGLFANALELYNSRFTNIFRVDSVGSTFTDTISSNTPASNVVVNDSLKVTGRATISRLVSMDSLYVDDSLQVGKNLLVGTSAMRTILDANSTVFLPNIYSSKSSGGVSGIATGYSDGVNNRRVGLFVDQTNSAVGLSYTFTSGTPDFYILGGAVGRTLKIIGSSGDVRALQSLSSVFGTFDTTLSGSIANQLVVKNNATASGTGSELRLVNSTQTTSTTNGATMFRATRQGDGSNDFAIVNAIGSAATAPVSFGMDGSKQTSYFGTSGDTTAKVTIRNGLIADALKIYNSRGTVIAKVDSVGSVTQTGSIKGIATKTADYTLTASDYTILVSCSSADLTMTLPAAASHTGRLFNIKKIDTTGYSVIIDGNGSETIDGYTNITFSSKNTVYSIQSDGTNWQIVH